MTWKPRVRRCPITCRATRGHWFFYTYDGDEIRCHSWEGAMVAASCHKTDMARTLSGQHGERIPPSPPRNPNSHLTFPHPPPSRPGLPEWIKYR